MLIRLECLSDHLRAKARETFRAPCSGLSGRSTWLERAAFAVLRVLAETFLGRALSLAGRHGEAVKMLEDSEMYAESIQFRATHTLSLAWLADAHRRAGRVAHAMTTIDRALQATRAHGQPAAEAEVFLALAASHAAGERPDLEAARTATQQAISLADDLGARPVVARGHLTLGHLSHQAGASEQARNHFTLAAGMFANMGMDYWLEQVEAQRSSPG